MELLISIWQITMVRFPVVRKTNFGKILKENFQGYRDEMIISSKAGHEMWAGPYGGNSSRKI